MAGDMPDYIATAQPLSTLAPSMPMTVGSGGVVTQTIAITSATSSVVILAKPTSGDITVTVTGQTSGIVYLPTITIGIPDIYYVAIEGSVETAITVELTASEGGGGSVWVATDGETLPLPVAQNDRVWRAGQAILVGPVTVAVADLPVNGQVEFVLNPNLAVGGASDALEWDTCWIMGGGTSFSSEYQVTGINAFREWVAQDGAIGGGRGVPLLPDALPSTPTSIAIIEAGPFRPQQIPFSGQKLSFSLTNAGTSEITADTVTLYALLSRQLGGEASVNPVYLAQDCTNGTMYTVPGSTDQMIRGVKTAVYNSASTAMPASANLTVLVAGNIVSVLSLANLAGNQYADETLTISWDGPIYSGSQGVQVVAYNVTGAYANVEVSI